MACCTHMAKLPLPTMPHTRCISGEDASQTASVALLDLGTLLASGSSFFPYYMLVALEAGGLLRAFVLLAISPFVWFASRFVSEAVAIRMLVFVSMAGLRLSEVCTVSRAVLPKFFLDDLRSDSYRIFLACKKRHVISCHPRILIEDFVKAHLGVDSVLGTELQTSKRGYCTGFVADSGILMDDKKSDAVRRMFGDVRPDLGLGANDGDNEFLSLCKEACMVPADKTARPVPKGQYLAPVVFHDGRLVIRPTPLASLAIFLWLPFGAVLGFVRLYVGLTLPRKFSYPILAMLGVTVRAKGAPPLVLQTDRGEGVLFVCTHRTLADPIFLSAALRRNVRAVTYSLSKFSELISPVKTSRLTRNRDEDEKIIRRLLMKDDLIICPEGTTCREPFLLRFSSLFASLADHVVPVAVNAKTVLFHCTSARGYKFLDPIFILMDPRPSYDIIFLEAVSLKQLRAQGKTSVEIANYVQKQLADALGFECTNFTRKDKYTILAGNDGTGKNW